MANSETITIPSERELDARVADGGRLHVRLLGRFDVVPPAIRVAVRDSVTGEAFSVPVGENDKPLEVFNHPFAYAASRTVEAVTAPALPEAAVFSD